jgi:hypothetical protein
MVFFSEQGGPNSGVACPLPCAEAALIAEQGARVQGAGRCATRQAGMRGCSRVNRRGHRQLGGRTDDTVGLQAAILPSSPRKIALAMKKVTENPIYKLSAFCGGSGT